jgi:hypothetical protein
MKIGLRLATAGDSETSGLYLTAAGLRHARRDRLVLVENIELLKNHKGGYDHALDASARQPRAFQIGEPIDLVFDVDLRDAGSKDKSAFQRLRGIDLQRRCRHRCNINTYSKCQ